MNLIDMHCDTLWKMIQQNEYDLMENPWSVSIPAMKEAGTLAQFFACFTCLEEQNMDYEKCYEQALAMIELLKKNCEKYSEEICMAGNYEDILKNEQNGQISAVLTIEEGGIINGKAQRLEELWEKGVRLMTPMWNYTNCLGHPNSREPELMAKGLTKFGKEIINRAGELGMIIDVSHASDQSFLDILECTDGPVVASHSNCRALCRHPRNLTDEMIRRLAEAGGVAGLNLFPMFLGENLSPGMELEAMTAHVLHMINVGGEEFPAIGTDADGYSIQAYEPIQKVSDMPKLWEMLRKKGVSEDQLERIWRTNAVNVLKRIG